MTNLTDQSRVEEWNAAHPTGTKVVVEMDDGSKLETYTEGAAALLGGHTAVIWVRGVSGCYRLDRVKVAGDDLDPEYVCAELMKLFPAQPIGICKIEVWTYSKHTRNHRFEWDIVIHDWRASVLIGAAYVPFSGDGDITAELYYNRPPITKVFAADLDPARTATLARRMPAAITATGDCDVWPFANDIPDLFSVADFDAYSYPYDSFRAFFTTAKLAPRLVLFFTDGQRFTIRKGPGSRASFHHPNGEKIKPSTLDWNKTRRIFNFYMKQITLPWLASVCGNRWTINLTKHYLRDSMIYWGAVITRK